MEEKNKHNLKKTIQELPAFKPDFPDLWKGIEQRLDRKKIFDNLPEHKAPSGLWEKVEQKLNKKPVHRSLFSAYYVTRIAASIILLATIGMLIKYEYIRRSLNEVSHIEKPDAKVMNALGLESIYNSSLCKGNPQICNTPLFKSLDKQLNEVKGELDQMKPMIQNGDPHMMKYYYRLEKERVEVEKKMVKIIMES